jgi:hypothetical protein
MPLTADVTIDSTTWAAVAFVLTVLGAAYTWVSYQRRGPAAGLRGLAWTLVPVALWLTGTLKLTANIVNDVIDWATRLVFSPRVWLGVIVAGAVVALWVVSGAMRARGIGTRGVVRTPKEPKGVRAADPGQPAVKKTKRKGNEDDIDDLDDIEAILKRHGI